MSIERLRAVVRGFCEFEVLYISRELADKYGLTEKSPANVDSSNKIYILESLSEEQLIQAEAHELGHLYVNSLGIIKRETNGWDPIGFLNLEFNNAVSHRFVVDILQREFGISSDFHLELRTRGLNEIPQLIDDCKGEIELLYGIGLILFDIKETVPDKGIKIRDLLLLSQDVAFAFGQAETYLKQIKIGIPLQEQQKITENFFSTLVSK